MIDVTVWMNMPSFYQDELYRVLASSGEVDLRVVYARDLPPDRKQLGWTEQTGAYHQRVLNPGATIPEAMRLAWSQRQRLHIVNGIWAEPAFTAALGVLGAAGGTFAIYAEPPIPTRARSAKRRLLRSTLGRWVASRPGANLMPISRAAADFYGGLGFPAEKMYPFPYVRKRPCDNGAPSRPPTHRGLELLYVGQLIHRKGLDLLLDAIAPLMATVPDLTLSLVGSGAERDALMVQAQTLGIAGRTRFEAPVPSDRIRARIAQADALVLPSRWDGWGLVVNEALSVGRPVIVSDACGAAELISDGENGYVFRGQDTADLRRRLAQFIAAPRRAEMNAAAKRTGERTSAEATVPYLIDCLRRMTDPSRPLPTPPWR